MIYSDAVDSNDKLKRGIVWCHQCGRNQMVNSAKRLEKGWPKCCGYTMSLDSPEERKQDD